MGCKNHCGSLCRYARDDLVHQRRRKRRFGMIARAAGHQNMFFRRQSRCLEYLAPAIGEVSVAQDHHRLVFGELPRHGFHGIGPAAGHQGHGIRIVNVPQHCRDVAHHLLKGRTHMVQRAVGEDDGEFEQPIRVDVGA